MPFFNPSLRKLCLSLTFVSTLWAAAIPQSEEQAMIYSWWKLPTEFSAARIEKLLQQLCEQTYEKGFKYLGVEEDLFHGHILFERKEHNGIPTLFPRAILYHTQEEAHKAHWEKSIDSKYDYLNVASRNWIQWLNDEPNDDGLLIENAKKYLDVTKKEPAQFEIDFAEPQEKWHYTIHASNLDNKKLGFALAGELQFEFKDASQSTPDIYGNSLGVKGPITVKVPLTDPVTLNLSTSTMYIERHPTP